jgi:glycosyltransferase involved in cell wall biosynthesis
MPKPEIAVLVSSFERPGHLRRVLASIAAQRGVGGALEVVVTDDGSRDETPQLVRRFAASVGFPVRFTTHPHDGFQLSRCRNEGVRASTAPYLLFLDGDCILPPDHLRVHLDRRRAGYAMAGYYIYLSQEISEQISDDDVREARYLSHITASQRMQIGWRHLRASYYSLIGDPRRPKLLGGNLGIARADYERVNGYDENFQGWGCEDDDLRLRLRAGGVNVASIAWWTNTYHLWHPKTPSAPATWRAGANVDYFERPLRLTRCLAGINKRRLQDLQIRIVGQRPPKDLIDKLPLWCRVAAASNHRSATTPEIEIAFAGGSGQFSDGCNCRLLVVPRGQTVSANLARAASLIFSDTSIPGEKSDRCFKLREFDTTLQRQLGCLSTAMPAARLIAA